MQNSDQIKEAPTPAGEDRLDEAARELAKAFATIEEYSDFIPPHVHNGIGDALCELCDGADWQSNPMLMRLVLPHVLRAAIKNRERFEV